MYGILNFISLIGLSLGTFSTESLAASLGSQTVDLYYRVVSGASTYAVGPDLVNGGPAVPTYNKNSGWTASVPGATWVWDAAQVSSPTTSQTVTFTDYFIIPCAVVSASLVVASDNSLTTTINGTPVTCPNNSLGTYGAAVTCDISQFISSGVNTIQFVVQNIGFAGATYLTNPAGIIYSINIHGTVIQ